MPAPVPDESSAYPPGYQPMGPGTVLLGKYRVVEQLGLGGMGYVVAAEHLELGTRVAMKFLLPQFVMMRESAARFVREARTASRIPSEHIARVLDAGALPDGAPYMVMEYLDGQDLSRWLRDGSRCAIDQAIDWVAQAGEALAHAHAVGIVHRDVKPANLFLTRRSDGTPLIKVLDFGISKVMEEAQLDIHLTKTTSVLGSGLYMSPEQMRSARAVDQRTDVYALGICLYELLTRTQPFTAESFSELCLKVNLEPPDPIRRHRPDVPEALATVIARAYAKNADDRYPTMSAFLRALVPYATPQTRAIIDAVQRIGGDGVVEAAAIPLVVRTHAPRAPSGGPPVAKILAVGAAIAALAAAGTVLVAKRPWRTDVAPDPIASAGPSEPGSGAPIAPPPPIAAVTAAPSAEESASPPAAGSASAPAASSASGPRPRPPRPPAPPASSASAPRPRPPRPPAPPCLEKDPITGLKNLPCK